MVEIGVVVVEGGPGPVVVGLTKGTEVGAGEVR